jgi:hypothetical protein
MWKLADVIDFVHAFVVIPLLAIAVIYVIRSKNERRKDFAGIACCGLVAVQATLGNCPLTMLSWWLRRSADPYFSPRSEDVLFRIYRWLDAEAPYVRWAILSLALACVAFYLWDLRWQQQQSKAQQHAA